MLDTINTVLIVGGTSGIGEGFARRLHDLGKKVIITGRRQDRLNALATELPSLETVQWDISDLTNLIPTSTALLQKFPAIDTIILTAGIQHFFSFFDNTAGKESIITNEITTNLTAPLLLCTTLLPHLSSLAQHKPTHLIFVGSGLGFVPLGLFPAYCPAKAGIHSLAVLVRQQVARQGEVVRGNLGVVELVPPYVDTGLDGAFREEVHREFGGHVPEMVGVGEYVEEVLGGLEREGEKEVAGKGFAETAVGKWREAFGGVFEGLGMDC
ncbi:NAD(P)-binding protein [Polyplosphaeria fusca]|uniref:NAD(P)-binding protein n=1 Tax=Polyplosphaeria fusca TaxID=682080 RepID=A0A9P4QS63_9PLEO|nr:NAD(P)-binding protein [Polyplosphaeria fusca]